MADSTALYLTPEEINLVVENLRTKGGEHISRGRGGNGFGYKDGVFYAIYVEEFDQENTPFTDEADFRRHLASIDLSNDRYRRWALEGLGASPSFSIENKAAIEAALLRQSGVAIHPAQRWNGVVQEIERAPGFVYLRLGQTEPKIYAQLTEALTQEIQQEGASLEALIGKRVFLESYLAKDLPAAGCVSLRVASRRELRW